MNENIANESGYDDSWLTGSAEIFPIGSVDQIALMLSRFLEWGRVYFVATIDDSRGRSVAVAKKIGALGLLGIDYHAPCQRQGVIARLLKDELFCDVAEVTLDCIEAWANSILHSSGLLGYNASIVVDAKGGADGALRVAERQAEFFAMRKQRKFAGRLDEVENEAIRDVVLNDSVFGATVVFFQSDYTTNLYAAVYSRTIPRSDRAQQISNGPDPAKYWNMRYR